MAAFRRPSVGVIAIAVSLQLGGNIDRTAGFIERLLVVVVVLIVIHVDRTFNIDFVLLPGNDPDGIRDLKIHRDKAAARQVKMLLDDLLRAHRDGSRQYHRDKQTVFHI